MSKLNQSDCPWTKLGKVVRPSKSTIFYITSPTSWSMSLSRPLDINNGEIIQNCSQVRRRRYETDYHDSSNISHSVPVPMPSTSNSNSFGYQPVLETLWVERKQLPICSIVREDKKCYSERMDMIISRHLRHLQCMGKSGYRNISRTNFTFFTMICLWIRSNVAMMDEAWVLTFRFKLCTFYKFTRYK